MEFRPGRYVKITPDGKVLGRATESEIRAWFSIALRKTESSKQVPSKPSASSAETSSRQAAIPPAAASNDRTLDHVDQAVTDPEPEPVILPEETPIPPVETLPASQAELTQIGKADPEPSISRGLVAAQGPTPPIEVPRRPPRPEPLSEQVRDLAPQFSSTPLREAASLSVLVPRAGPLLEDSSARASDGTVKTISKEAATDPGQTQGDDLPVTEPGNRLISPQSEGETAASAPTLETPSAGPVLVPVQVALPLDELLSEPTRPSTTPTIEAEPAVPINEPQPSSFDEPRPTTDGTAASERMDVVAADDGSRAAKLFREPVVETLEASPSPEPDVGLEPAYEPLPDSAPDEVSALPFAPVSDPETELISDETGLSSAGDQIDATGQDVTSLPTIRQPPKAPASRMAAPPVDARQSQGEDEAGTGTDPRPVEVQDNWLWVDPRYESSYHPATFDIVAFLQRAIALFQTKAWSGGHKPGRMVVHPHQLDDGLEEAAEQLGLTIQTDPTVGVGTFRLGAAEVTEK